MITYDEMRREIDDRFRAANAALNAEQAQRNRAHHTNLTIPQWIIVEQRIDGAAWMRGVVKIIWSLAIEQDDQPWLHVSVSRSRTPAEPIILPSYFDMKRAKALVCGPERIAYSVWAAEGEHININPGVLHLFCPVDAEVRALPDFTHGLATL